MWAALGAVTGGYRYFIAVLTTPHRYTHVQMLKTRVEAPQFCYDQMAWIDRNREDSIKRLYSDSAEEFLSMGNV